MKIREMNAKIALSHSDFHRYKIKGFSEALDFLNERAVPGHHTLGLKYQNIFVTLQSDRPWSVQTFLNQRGVMSSACTDKA